MAELLKFKLQDATPEEQAKFDDYSGDFILMTSTPQDMKNHYGIVNEYNGKEEILNLLSLGVPDSCFLGIREAAAVGRALEGENQVVITFNRVYLLKKPGATLPQPQSIRPKNAIINNSKVANMLQKIERATDGSQAEFEVVVDNKKSVKVFAFLRYDTAEISGEPLTAFDKVVHNAVCSLFAAGNEHFNLQMVYRAMNGRTDKKSADPVTLEPIRHSIEKMIVKRFGVDATEQAQAWNADIERAIYRNYLLPLESVTVLFKNSPNPEEAYHFLKTPPLFEYSRQFKQVIAHDIKLLDTREAGSYSPELAVIREYLIQRISVMKHQKNGVKGNCINYSSLYQDCDIDEESLTQTEKNRKRDKIKKLLEHFKQQGFISGYEEYKKGRSFEGVKILP